MNFCDVSGRTPARRSPLKVGYVLKRFPRLTETFILNEILELERQGAEVEIYSLLKPRDEPRHRLLSQLRGRVHYLPDRRSLDGWTVRQGRLDATSAPMPVADLVGENPVFPELMPGKKRADTILLMQRIATIAALAQMHGVRHLHAHFASDATTAALLTSRLSGIPFSFTAHARDIYHTYVSRAVDDRARRIKLREARFAVTVSDYNKRHLLKIGGGRDRCDVVRLYNGIDLDRLAPRPDSIRRTAHILCVARLVEKKGIGDLIEACHIIDRQATPFECTIVGDGPLMQAYQAAIESRGLAEKVRLVGALAHEEVVAQLQTSTLMVLPCVVAASGDRDGLPTVLLEALACGLPSVSTNVAGIPEIISADRTGLLVPPGHPEALAGAVSKLLDDPTLRANFAAAGRDLAQTEFCLSKNVERLHKLFAASAGRSPGNHEDQHIAHSLY